VIIALNKISMSSLLESDELQPKNPGIISRTGDQIVPYVVHPKYNLTI
jgi:hypothetical protein